MKFVPLEIEGAFVVAAEPVVDERGFFARTYCAQEFADHGMASVFVQASVSSNRVAGTLRGMLQPCAIAVVLLISTCSSLWPAVLFIKAR